MTAKQALIEIVGELTEEDARKLFPFLSGREWTETWPGDAERLSNEELLRLPATLRDHIIRSELAKLSQAELDGMVAEAEEWRFSDANVLKHIDGAVLTYHEGW